MMLRKTVPFILVLSLILSDCKKGEDDPLISLRTRKARMEGKWKMVKGFKTKEMFGSTKVVYTGSSFERSSNNAVLETGSPNYTIDFQKDGKVIMQRMLESGDQFGLKGTWNFTGGVGKAKNKEQVLIHDGTRSPDMDLVFNIKELRNKKLVLRRTMEFPDGGTYYEEEFEFEQ